MGRKKSRKSRTSNKSMNSVSKSIKQLDDKVEGANDDEVIIEMQESDEQVNSAPVSPIVNWDI